MIYASLCGQIAMKRKVARGSEVFSWSMSGLLISRESGGWEIGDGMPLLRALSVRGYGFAF